MARGENRMMLLSQSSAPSALPVAESGACTRDDVAHPPPRRRRRRLFVQVVIYGAGMDARGLRLRADDSLLEGIAWFEVDAPASQRAKRAALAVSTAAEQNNKTTLPSP